MMVKKTRKVRTVEVLVICPNCGAQDYLTVEDHLGIGVGQSIRQPHLFCATPEERPHAAG
jgi:hypothetical protein